MKTERINTFCEEYARQLARAIRKDPQAYGLEDNGPADAKALRVALHTAYLIEQYGSATLMPEARGIRATCEKLKIPATAEGLQRYFDGR